MTEPANTTAPSATVGPASPASPASRDYWDMVLAQLWRKPSVLIAVPVLVLLYAMAIYAPFLANDRPLVLEATHRSAFTRAQTSLRPISLNLRGLVRDGPTAWDERQLQRRDQRLAADPEAEVTLPTYAHGLEAEAEAIAGRLTTVSAQLAPSDRPLLEQARTALGATVAAAVGGDPDAEARADELVELTRRIKSELAPVAAGEDPVPGQSVALIPVVSYPALEALSRGDIYFMLLWLAVMTWPLWNPALNRLLLRRDAEAMRKARRPKFLAVILLPLIPALLWTGESAAFETAGHKHALTVGEMTATRVVFTPFAFGYAEVDDAEFLRPPTWHGSAEITDEGYYARGARADSLDDVAGFRPPPQPVSVEVGEPALNAVTRHPLGTDSLGRDLVSRIIWGARVSLSVGLVSTLFLVVIGIILGALAGYHGRWVDVIISRVIEIVQCFPVFFLILMVVAFTRQSGILPIMVVIGVFRWTGVARLVRGEFIRLRHSEFVVASEALGVSHMRTIFRHMLPNALGPVLVAATFSVAAGILIESALSFLGFGIELPIPSWGSLINESRSAEHWWIQVFPGVFIFLTVMLYNLLGEGVRDALDPRIKKV